MPEVRIPVSAGEMPAWLEWVSFAAGIALVLCTRNWRALPGKILCLGIAMGVSYATEKTLTAAFGKPVHAPTGAKILDGSMDLDFELAARLPLRWMRTYNSMDTADGPLGPGWRLPILVTLTATGAAVSAATRSNAFAAERRLPEP